ncbi:MAG: hypothetical protein NT166_28685 [Candidatus Aminicenantes bacterium]|nr:hypothetical protein [Candidatus Aminicenantes bacterium]
MKEITISKEFVVKANELLSKLSKDSAFETRLHKMFNKDAEFIKESRDYCENAQVAEDEYERETKEASEAKKEFEKKHEVAVFNYTRHIFLLKLLLKYDAKKQTALGLTGREEPKNKEEWFVNAMDVYDKIIGDSAAVELMEGYNFKLADLQQGHQTIVLAREANNTLAKESAEAKSAMFNKDYTFSELYDRMQIIQFCCYYMFVKEPKKFKELGLPIIDNEIGALITMVKDSSITKDMVKDSSITKAAETNPMVKDSSITKMAKKTPVTKKRR